MATDAFGSGSSAPPQKGQLTTFADMQTAGQARPTPPGYAAGPMYLQPMPMLGDTAPPPPVYMAMSANAPNQALPPPPADPNPTPANPTGGSGSGPPAPPANPSTSSQNQSGGNVDWNSYSPLSGLTEEEKAQYWAGQGVKGLAYGAQPTGYTGNPTAGGAVAKYNPQQTASNDASLAAAGQNNANVQGVQKNQADALAAYNAGHTPPPITAPSAPNSSLSPGNATRNLIPQDRSGGGSGMPQQTYSPPGIQTDRPQPTDRPANPTPTNPTGGPGTPGGQTYQPPPGLTNPATIGWTGQGSNDLAKLLMQRISGFSPYTSGVEDPTKALVTKMLTQPSPYDSQMFQDNYNMLSRNLAEQYGQQAKGINEAGAKRGLYDSSHVVGQLGDLGVQHDRANHDLALQLLTQRAQQLSTDQNNAVNAANAYAGQGLNQFNTNEGALSNRINQATGYDQSLFNRSLSTAEFNAGQDQQMRDFWLKLMGY